MNAGVIHREWVSVDLTVLPFASDAIARLSYLFPKISFSASSGIIEVECTEAFDISEVRKEVRYALYRSKIRAEGTENRNALFAAVFER